MDEKHIKDMTGHIAHGIHEHAKVNLDEGRAKIRLPI
jgi:hypothetical protein